MFNNFPKAITVTFHYDKHIQKITGVPFEPAVINEGMPFIMLLMTLFRSYPEIEHQYPPGVLGFAVNGKPPQEFDIMQDGDKVMLLVAQ